MESLWGGSPAVESVSTGLDSADVQDEAESITDELCELIKTRRSANKMKQQRKGEPTLQRC